MNLEDVAAAMRDRLDALGPFARAELLRCLLLPDYQRAGMIGEYHQDPRTRNFAELLIDAEEDKVRPGGARRDAARDRAPPLRVARKSL